MSVPLITAPLTKVFAAIGKMGSGLQAALSLGTTALGFAGQQQMANQQNAAIEAANESARVQMIQNNDQLSMQAKQAKDQAVEKTTEVSKEAARRAATATVAASEAGVSGLSVNALLADLYGQEATQRDSIQKNLEGQIREVGVGFNDNAMAYKNTVQSRSKVARPSLLGAAISGFTGIADAYKDDLRVNPK